MNAPIVRLTSLAHGGGCGCKLAPSVLQELLANQPAAAPFRQLLVGIETGDDAAVWKIDDSTCVVATTDFFMPVVDDPFDFGRIAATNAISDIYAMGAKPIMALAILGMPLNKVSVEDVRKIIAGGNAVCSAAGIPVAGGHSIDAPEPIYGLVVIGLCHPDKVRRNADAKPGDALILTKAIGVGIYSAAIKKGELSGEGYAEMVASTTQLNRVGAELADDKAVHAITDVTGFGLLGHALEMARGSKLTVTLKATDVPLFTEAARLAQQGYITGASTRNWASYGDAIRLPDELPDWQRSLLVDPQTSGGLLISCAADHAEATLEAIRRAGYGAARIIGHTEAGPAEVRVTT
ncbi:selenide, water dikinase SelD [Bradyrhizobium sp. SYSU BS000235]|uniref:selenide, water dikinase SelD n=1 Tax=Bradyrhizobium sp. SYSU BS000235 TaxID=3411332 RepID=UPI003C7525BD